MEPPAIQHCRSRDGLRVSYRVTGEGPPLLLVHGLTMQAATWQPYIDRLATRFHVIALDLRGHSGSDRPHDPAAYALDRVIQDLHAVLQAVHVERAHCWGYSLGARILLTAINDAPNRFARVVLGGSHAAALDPKHSPRRLPCWDRTSTLTSPRSPRRSVAPPGVSSCKTTPPRWLLCSRRGSNGPPCRRYRSSKP